MARFHRLGVTLLASVAWLTGGAPVEAQTATVPNYNAEGKLILPVGFEEWVFVGADPGVASTGSVREHRGRSCALYAAKIFHNIYINREAYDFFRANKEFPEPTLLVMEEFEANDKDPGNVLERGVFEDIGWVSMRGEELTPPGREHDALGLLHLHVRFRSDASFRHGGGGGI